MATDLMPSSLQAQMTRRAISPRFAIRILLNMDQWQLPFADAEQRQSVFHRASVGDKYLADHARDFGLDLIHQFHRFDNAQRLPLLHGVADLHERRSARRGSFIERAHNRRFQDKQISLFGGHGPGGGRTGVRRLSSSRGLRGSGWGGRVQQRNWGGGRG